MFSISNKFESKRAEPDEAAKDFDIGQQLPTPTPHPLWFEIPRAPMIDDHQMNNWSAANDVCHLPSGQQFAEHPQWRSPPQSANRTIFEEANTCNTWSTENSEIQQKYQTLVYLSFLLVPLLQINLLKIFILPMDVPMETKT